MIPGPQKIGELKAMAIEAIMHKPTMINRTRLFWTISPPHAGQENSFGDERSRVIKGMGKGRGMNGKGMI
jgi:hypothetical protein